MGIGVEILPKGDFSLGVPSYFRGEGVHLFRFQIANSKFTASSHAPPSPCDNTLTDMYREAVIICTTVGMSISQHLDT